MPKYLLELEDKLAAFAVEGSDTNFRLILTSEPNPEIPIGLLEKSIKITSEPPQGMSNNLKRAFTFFDKNEFEDKENKLKTILFALCYFHAMMIERRKFGSKGFNQRYPFNIGDLRDSAIVLQNYLDGAAGGGKIPWDDLRYIFGEIMYGGHIVDDWDRVFCAGFLRNLMNDQLLDEVNMFPFTDNSPIQFKCPPATTYDRYVEYIDQELPAETPLAYGMHPNTEIDFRTMQCQQIFDALIELTPKDSAAGDENAPTVDSKVAEFNERVQNEASLESNRINVDDLVSKLSDDMRGPFQNTFIQECELINTLCSAILRSLADVELANKGELTRSEAMEVLMGQIFNNKVPTEWMKYSFETTRGLGSWLDNIKQRLE
jgi:dynein heavy chain